MSIHPVQGGVKGYHNYYVPSEYLRWNENDGVIHTRDGLRAARVDLGWIRALHSALEQEIGQAGAAVLYRAGFQWAQSDMVRFAARMRVEYGGGRLSIHEMNRRFVLETWWCALALLGWGRWTLCTHSEHEGTERIELHQSVHRDACEGTGLPACQLYAGLFAGCISHMDGELRAATEFRCGSLAGGPCVFFVGSRVRIRDLREQGAHDAR